MNAKKKILAIGLFTAIIIANSYILSMENRIIPNASYCIYEGATPGEVTGGILGSSKHVTFYTFDGNPIITIGHHFNFESIEKMLDPHAPKPQPTSCLIKCWPTVSIGFEMERGMLGWFIIFCDKSGNSIESYCYDKEKHEIAIYSHVIGAGRYLFNEDNPKLIDKAFPLDLGNISSVRTKAAPVYKGP